MCVSDTYMIKRSIPSLEVGNWLFVLTCMRV